MLRTVVLRRREGYRAEGILFERGVPKRVDEQLARRLLERGIFQEILPDEVSEGLASDGNGELSHLAHKDPPKNVLGDDDLTGKRILLKRQGGIGDLVFVAHVANAIKYRYPEAYVALGARDDLLAFCSLFDCVDDSMSLQATANVETVQSFDYVIHFNGTIESQQVDETDYYEAHFERAGFDFGYELPLLTVHGIATMPSLQNEAQEVLNKAGIGDLPYAVLLLGSSNPLKRPHPNLLTAIAERISTDENADPLHVLCIGGERDRMFPARNERIAFAREQSLPVSVELVRRSRCVVGSDTGLLHFAAGLGIPTVSFWGPTDDKLTIPHYKSPVIEHATIRSEIECSPCKRLRTSWCPYFKGGYANCMRQVDPQRVADAAKRAADATGVTPHPAATLQSPVDLPVYTADAESAQSKLNVCVLLDNTSYYSGGNFYAWQVSKLLARRLQPHSKVYVVLSDGSELRCAADDEPHSDNLHVVPQEKAETVFDNVDFQLFVGTPPTTGTTAVAACEAGDSQSPSASILLCYETPNYIADYRSGLDAKESYWAEYKEALLKADCIFAISPTVRRALREWDERFANKRIEIVYPPVNTDVADPLLPDTKNIAEVEKKDRVVLISRNMDYKGLRNAIFLLLDKVLPQFRRPFEVVVIGQRVERLRKTIAPEHRSGDLKLTLLEEVPEREKWKILREAKILVHPSDFEGFGIPLAEAMYAGTPVLAKPLEVFADCFKSHAFYYTGDEQFVRAAGTLISLWDRRDTIDIEAVLRPPRAHVARRYTLSQVGVRVSGAFRKRGALRTALDNAKMRAQRARVHSSSSLRVAYITTWGTQCGIAETTKEFVQHLKCTYRILACEEPQFALVGDQSCTRCWNRTFSSAVRLKRNLLEFKPDIVHIEHEFSFFRNTTVLYGLMDDLRQLGIKVVVTLHTFAPSASMDALTEHADRVVVTKDHPDLSSKFSVVDLPAKRHDAVDRFTARQGLNLDRDIFAVGAFGMWHPHKGYIELLDTLNDVTLRCTDKTRYILTGYGSPKTQYYKEVFRKHRKAFDSGRAIRYIDFFERDDLFRRLAACDILVFNYNIVGHSSASAAIRDAMAAGRPVICTVSPMFEEFEHETHVLKVRFGEQAELSDAIVRLYEDRNLTSHLVQNCFEYLKRCAPERVAAEHEKLYRELKEETLHAREKESVEVA